MLKLPGSVTELERELCQVDIDHVGAEPNLGREFLIARLRIPTVDNNTGIGRMEPNQIDADIKRLQVNIGVDLVEAGIDAAVHAIVADFRQGVGDFAAAKGNVLGPERRRRCAAMHRKRREGTARASADLQGAAASASGERQPRRKIVGIQIVGNVASLASYQRKLSLGAEAG